jgi:crotonobetainyl-CoA:carnitine CoA-transferase CaiB-like acyl-CoA transferase
MNNLDALVGEIELVTRSQTVAHWQSVFDAAGVPAGPVHSLEQALTHEQTLARAMVVNSKHPKAGHVQGIGHPIKFSNHSPVTESSPPPMLSEHAFDILTEFNYSEAEIEALVAQGAVASPGVDQ